MPANPYAAWQEVTDPPAEPYTDPLTVSLMSEQSPQGFGATPADAYADTFSFVGPAQFNTVVSPVDGTWRLDTLSSAQVGYTSIWGATPMNATRFSAFWLLTPALALPPDVLTPPDGYHLELDGGALASMSLDVRAVVYDYSWLVPPTQAAVVAAPADVWAGNLGSTSTPAEASTWTRSTTFAPVSRPTSSSIPPGPDGDLDSVIVTIDAPCDGSHAALTALAGPQYAAEPFSGLDTIAGEAPSITGLLRAASNVQLQRAPYRWRWVPNRSGLWRMRQRQSLAGADSWPPRARQNGGATGSWAVRQRQTGL